MAKIKPVAMMKICWIPVRHRRFKICSTLVINLTVHYLHLTHGNLHATTTRQEAPGQ
jgi:hypothetical protein